MLQEPKKVDLTKTEIVIARDKEEENGRGCKTGTKTDKGHVELAAFLKDSGLLHSTHSSPRESDTLFSHRHKAHMWCTYTQAGKTLIHIK